MLWDYLDGLTGPGLTLLSCICLGIHPFPPDFPALLSIGFLVGSDDFLNYLSFSCYVPNFLFYLFNLVALFSL